MRVGILVKPRGLDIGMQRLDEIRERFQRFFQERDHAVVPPSSLIPEDPSVLFTTAGMQQFKPYYTGERDPVRDVHGTLGKALGSTRAVSIQPCMRTSDIDDVGDTTHLTFFEMCGNFAFRGAYFKREAIEYAWQFLTEAVEIEADRLSVTVFSGDETLPRDEDARKAWHAIGIPDARITPGGRETNFWGPTGQEGPCGPTTEIHYDMTGVPCGKGKECMPNCSCGRFLEMWNLVFNEFYKNPEGKLMSLSAKGVDTGMGLERLALVLFSAPDVFASPFFTSAMGWMLGVSSKFPQACREELGHHRVGSALAIAAQQTGSDLRSARIIADHLRASIFLIHAGILPANVERGYILRRLIRRAALHARLLALPMAWAQEITEQIVAVYANTYTEVTSGRLAFATTLKEELAKFESSIERGVREFERLAHERRMSARPMTGEDLFGLFETHGFPLELSRELAVRAGITVDERDLAETQEKHKTTSRAGAERKFGGHGLVLNTGELRASTDEEVVRVTRLHTATHLLHAALRKLLGDGVSQAGSDITAERLRFDFTFPRKVTADELAKTEALINEKIKEDLPVEKTEMPFRDAVASGALAFARGAYPEVVSVYSVPGFSREVCGGPHVTRTREVGTVKIVREEASAKGIRRIRATVAP